MGHEEDHIGSPELMMRIEEVSGGALDVCLSETPDVKLFDQVAAVLSQKTGGRWVAKADGGEERSWDLAVSDAILTLHLDGYRGISLRASSGSADIDRANQLVLELAQMLREQVE
jgi:hypothetical protein